MTARESYLLAALQRESNMVNQQNGVLAFVGVVFHRIMTARSVDEARTFAELALGYLAEFREGMWEPGPADDPADWRTP